jgi:hypothetical protein
MWWSKAAIGPLLVMIAVFCIRPAIAAEVCPSRQGQSLRFVDVFDGAPEDLATLIPDVAGKSSGYWRLGYVYAAGRFVTVRCKYADGSVSDVKLSIRVHRCDYKIDERKTLRLNCR